MNKRPLWILLCLVMAVACNTRNKHDAETAGIMQMPPFASITDSISRYPQDVDLYMRRAELLLHANQNELALADHKKAWQLRPDEITAQAYISDLFVNGKEAEAISLLKDCVQKYPADAEFPRRLSEAYLQRGNAREALAEYNSTLAKDSANFETWYNRGILLASLKDTAQAIASLQRAYSLQPLQIYGLSLANLYAETKNQRVISLCDDLMKNDTSSDLIDAFFVKGIYYSNTNQPSLAVEQFDNCIRHDWKYTDAYIEKGIILFHQDNMDEALKTFALAAKVSNAYPDAYYWMGRCLESIGKKDEAKSNYYRALALDRNFVEASEGLKRLK